MSFAAEINDFINAANAGVKLIGARDDREYKRARTKYMQATTAKLEDPEMNTLNKDLLRARVSHYNRSGVELDENRRMRRAVMQEQLRGYKLRNDAFEKGGSDGGLDVDGVTDTIKGKQSALPVDDEFDTADLGDDYQPTSAIPEGDDYQPTQFAARGGAIKAYADGGAVEDTYMDGAEPDDDMDDTAEDQADEDTISSGPGFSVQAAHDAVRDGLNYGVQEAAGKGGQAQAKKSAIPEDTVELSAQSRQTGARRLLSGAGAATPKEMEAIKRAIDPEGKMSESQRNMAALGGIYQYKMNKGDPEGAKRAAFSMLQYYRQASQRWAAISKAAADNGDMDGATKAALKAYANIPDGRDVRIMKRQDGTVGYQMIDDQSGKVIGEGVLQSPQQIGALAMRAATDGFDQFILEAAGQRAAPASRRGAGGGVAKLTDRLKAEDEIATNYDPKTSGVDEKFGDAAKSVASGILMNNDVSRGDAIKISSALLNPNKQGDLKPTEDGGAVMPLDDGRQIKLPRNAYAQIVAIRGKMVKDADAARQKTLDDAGKRLILGAKERVHEDKMKKQGSPPLRPRMALPNPVEN